MEAERKKRSGRETQEKDGEAKDLFEKLQEQLYSANGSIRRQAGFNLSWMQEDGLEILKETLFGNSPATTKNAAAYGLRKMRGRMKKMALEILKEGLEHQNGSVREVCSKALILMGEIKPKETPLRAARGKLRIKDIPPKRRRRLGVVMGQATRRRPMRK